MAAEIRKKYPEAEVELVPSGEGKFEVTVDGKLIFSKAKLKRHAEKGEVIKELLAIGYKLLAEAELRGKDGVVG